MNKRELTLYLLAVTAGALAGLWLMAAWPRR